MYKAVKNINIGVIFVLLTKGPKSVSF